MYKCGKFRDACKNSMFVAYMFATIIFMMSVCGESRGYTRVLIYILGFSFGKLVVRFFH